MTAVLRPSSIAETDTGFVVEGGRRWRRAESLVYCSATRSSDGKRDTLQARLERAGNGGKKRQSTRYSVHGLHEYKGKFNPQVVRALVNILCDNPIGARVIDPFCGSGTSLVECAHGGIESFGVDINPLAVYVAKAKLAALQLEPATLQRLLEKMVRVRLIPQRRHNPLDGRAEYLEGWFDPEILQQIEYLQRVASGVDHGYREVFSCLVSNVLRDYSLQDPGDLRIRRRKTPLPTIPIRDAIYKAGMELVKKIAALQGVLGRKLHSGEAVNLDSRELVPGRNGVPKVKFDCAITSPPYATALPYIDTQRLSLVWLGLLVPEKLLSLEATLLGSREVRGARRSELLNNLLENAGGLPASQANYCLRLQESIGSVDGFRRRAVPQLLYRYFVGMAESFRGVRRCMKVGAPYALIVGRNHTTLGGARFDIDTPKHLAEIATTCGWRVNEVTPLQAYQRFGNNQTNAIEAESLILLSAS